MATPTIEIYDNTNTSLLGTIYATDGEGQQRGPRELSTEASLNTISDCMLTVSRDHPAAAFLVNDNVVRVIDGEKVDKFTIRSTRVVEYDGEEGHGGELITVEGPTLLERLQEGLVTGWQRDFRLEPQSDRMAFDFSSQLFDASGWETELFAQPRTGYVPGEPLAWVDSFSLQVFPVEEGDALENMHYYGIRDFGILADSEVVFFYTGDSKVSVHCNGVRLDHQEPEHPNNVYPYTFRASVPLEAGVHRFAIDVQVADGSVDGMWKVGCLLTDGSVPTTPLFVSGILEGNAYVGTWYVLAAPSEPPGFTFGEIAGILILSAQLEGTLLDVTRGFTDTHDSAGTPWPIISGYVPEIDQDVWKALESLIEGHVDLDMADDGLELLAWDKVAGKGEPSGETIAVGDNLKFYSTVIET